MRNIIIIRCINYIILIHINGINSIINNNCGRLQDLILVFKIPMVTRKDFFKIYKIIWYAPSERLASSVLG